MSRALLGWLKGRRGAPTPRDAPGGRLVEVGWLIDAPQATLIYDAPRPVSDSRPAAESAKALANCPAVLGLEARLFRIDCPVDLRLRLRNLATPRPVLVNSLGERSPVSRAALDRMVTLMPRERWRHPERPVLQVSAPWRFIADEPVWLSQLPPYCHHREQPLPGIMVGGRFPIQLWPRSLMWAFEWHDTDRDLVLNRGEPWFYVSFETLQPERLVRLVEAEMTDDLREYCRGLDGVTAYVNQTFDLFRTAAARRPATLLRRRRRR